MNDVLQESNKIYCGLYCTLFASLAGGFVISHSHARPPFVKIDMADMAYVLGMNVMFFSAGKGKTKGKGKTQEIRSSCFPFFLPFKIG